jgi:hypothetical protein
MAALNSLFKNPLNPLNAPQAMACSPVRSVDLPSGVSTLRDGVIRYWPAQSSSMASLILTAFERICDNMDDNVKPITFDTALDCEMGVGAWVGKGSIISTVETNLL